MHYDVYCNKHHSVLEWYETTGMCEVAVPLDFGKALLEDVLKSVTRS